MLDYFHNHQIIKDFDRFLTYICERPALQLTNDRAMLKGPDLIALNELMTSFKTELVTNKSNQRTFSLLNTFFFIAQESGLIYTIKNDKNNVSHLKVSEERIRNYDAMSDNEKYMALLEGFWCWIDWSYAFECRTFGWNEFYLDLAKKTIGKKYTLKDRTLKREGELNSPGYSFFMEVLSAFGFWAITWDDNITKHPHKFYCPYKDITLLHLGSIMTLPLLNERSRFDWANYESLNLFDFQEDEEDEEEDKKDEKFEDVFKPILDNLSIDNSLWRQEKAFVEGTYYFKVSLEKKLYRTIAIDANETYDDLHCAIQEAFAFDNDHLYAFFMNGREWSEGKEVYWSPYNDEGIFANNVKIGETNLWVGRSFLYLFDFGSSWYFNIIVKALNKDEQPLEEAKIVESVGESPKQYRWSDDDDDDE